MPRKPSLPGSSSLTAPENIMQMQIPIIGMNLAQSFENLTLSSYANRNSFLGNQNNYEFPNAQKRSADGTSDSFMNKKQKMLNGGSNNELYQKNYGTFSTVKQRLESVGVNQPIHMYQQNAPVYNPFGSYAPFDDHNMLYMKHYDYNPNSDSQNNGFVPNSDYSSIDPAMINKSSSEENEKENVKSKLNRETNKNKTDKVKRKDKALVPVVKNSKSPKNSKGSKSLQNKNDQFFSDDSVSKETEMYISSDSLADMFSVDHEIPELAHKNTQSDTEVMKKLDSSKLLHFNFEVAKKISSETASKIIEDKMNIPPKLTGDIVDPKVIRSVKLARNRASAQMCRLRRKLYSGVLEKGVHILEDQNNELLSKIQELEEERNKLAAELALMKN